MVINKLFLLFPPIGLFLFIGAPPGLNETLMLISFGYVGILTHYVKKWSEKVEKDEVMNIKKTIPSIILSVITTTVLIILRAEIETLFVFTRFGSFIVGYFGNSWFFGLIEKKMYKTNNNEI